MRKIWYVLTVLFVAVLLVCASQWKKTEDKLRELIIYEEEINHFEDDDGYDLFVPLKLKDNN